MSNKPAAKFSDGLIKVTVWENQSGQGRTFYTFETTQSYQDQGGAWQENGRLAGTDAIKAANLLQVAYNWSLTQKAADRANNG